MVSHYFAGPVIDSAPAAANSPTSPKRGLFITFEGGEGSGKSTQITRLGQALNDAGFKTAMTREPGGTPIGEKIRDLLKHDPAGQHLTDEAELLLFAASRAQLVRQFIEPRLERGVFVLSDRFLDSTTVYQGIARGLGIKTVTAINELAVGGLMPDITFLLDIDPDKAQSRIRARQLELAFDFADGEMADRLDSESPEFHRMVRDGYLGLARSHPRRVHVLNADEPVEVIAERIINHLCTEYGLPLAKSL